MRTRRKRLLVALVVVVSYLLFVLSDTTTENIAEYVPAPPSKSSPAYQSNSKRPGNTMIAIPLLDRRGYVNFTSSLLRTVLSNKPWNIHIFCDYSTNFSAKELKEWYGEGAMVHVFTRKMVFVNKIFELLKYTSSRFSTKWRNDEPALHTFDWKMNIANMIFEILKFFSSSEYDSLLVGSDDMIFSRSIYDFISANLNHTDLLLTYRSDVECNSEENGLCRETELRIVGSVMKKPYAKSLLQNPERLHDIRGIDVVLKGEDRKSISPVESLSIRIGQHFSEGKCTRYSEARNFDRCTFSKEIQDGIEFFLDKCNPPDKEFVQNLSEKNDVIYSKPAIAFSLYGGADPRYTDGALENSKLMLSIYPEWKMWVYHDESIPDGILRALCRRDVKLIYSKESKIMIKRAWRFLVASEKVTRYLIRDIDSRLSLRERAAVEEWKKSSKKFHVMRDHPSHASFAMNAGMWGGTQDAFPQMKEVLEREPLEEYYVQDQDFLTSAVWPTANKSVFQHDSFPSKYGEVHPFPTPRHGYEHVGSVYINGKGRQVDICMLKRALENEA